MTICTVYCCTLIGLSMTDKYSTMNINRDIMAEIRATPGFTAIKLDTVISHGNEVVDFLTRFETDFYLSSYEPIPANVKIALKSIMERYVAMNHGLKLILYAYALQPHPTFTIDLAPVGIS